MVSVRGHSETADFRIDSGAARLGRFHRLQYHHRATFAQNHSSPVLAERPAGVWSNHAHRFPGFQMSYREGRFAATGHRQIHFAIAHQTKRLANSMIRRRARGRYSVSGTGNSEIHGYMAGNGMSHRFRNRQRMNASAI